jgi:hypothetical protein
MASIISAGTTSGTALNMAGDTSGVLQLATNGSTTALTIDTSQNVGIGTASPASTFGTNVLQMYGSAATEMRFTSGNSGTTSTDGLSVGIDSSSIAYFYNRENQPTVFGTNNIERMRIDSSGNALVGTTANNFGTLAVFNNAATFATNQAICYFKSTQSGDVGHPGIYVVKFDNNSTTSQILIRFGINNGGNGQGQINANGGGAAAFGSFSDVRLKENIVDLPNQLENITALRPVEFDYKDGSGHQIGFIAQEMQEVYADTVSESSDGMLTITGWSKTEARLVKAIQEQQTIINDLKARITALEGAA